MNKLRRQSNKKILASDLFKRLMKIAETADKKSEITSYHFKSGDEIYKLGKNARSVFYISQGLVKLVRLQETGNESLVRLLSEKEFLGIISLSRGYQYSSSAVAVNESKVYRINRDFFMKALDTDDELSSLLLGYLLQSIYSAETRISELITKNVEERIATALLSLHFQDRETKKVTVAKKDLAAIAGTIQETISRKLSSMEKRGLIRLRRKEIILTNLQELTRMSKVVS